MKTPLISRYHPILLLMLLFAAVSCGNEAEETISQEEVLIEQDSVAEVLDEVDVIRDTLTGNWINADFLAAIRSNKSIYFSQNKMLPVAEVIIDEASMQMQLVFGYNEGCSGSFVRTNDQLKLEACDGNAAISFHFEYDPFKKVLFLIQDDIRYKLERSSSKVEEAGMGIQKLLAAELLQGNWQSVKATRPFGPKISFDTKGFVRGLSSYNKYSFVLGYDSYPAFMDVIKLQRGAQQTDNWYWQLEGDSLRFFSYKESAPDIFEQQAVYVRTP